MADIDLRSQGLYGALKNLKDGGFTASDAIKGFETRAAAAYTALSGNLDQMLSLGDAFLHTSASIQANDTQMLSLANQGRRLGGVLGALAATALQPFALALRDVLKWSSDFLIGLQQWPLVLNTLVGGVVSLATAFALWKFGNLVKGLYLLVAGQSVLQKVMEATAIRMGIVTVAEGAMATGAVGAAASTTLLGTAFRFALGPIGIMTLAIGGLVAALSVFNSSSTELESRLEKSQTEYDNSAGDVEQYTTRLETLDNQIQSLIDRHKLLSEDQHLLNSATEQVKNQFVAMGVSAENVGGTVDSLIKNLRDLRAEVAKEYKIKVGVSVSNLQGLIGDTEESRLNGLQAPQRAAGAFLALNSRTRRNVSAGVRAQGDTALNANSSWEQAALATNKLGEMARTARDQLKEATGAQRQQIETDLGYIDRILEGAQANVTKLQTLKNLQQDLTSEIAKKIAAEDATNPSVAALLAGSKSLGSSMRADILGAISPGAGARTQYRQGSDVFAAKQRDAEEMLRSIENLQDSGILRSTELADQIRTQISQSVASGREIILGLSEGAQEVVDGLGKADVAQAEETMNTAKKKVMEDPTFSKIQDFNVALAQFVTVKAKQIKEAGSDPEIEAADLAALKQQEGLLRQDVSENVIGKIKDAAKDAVKRVIERQESLVKIQGEALGEQQRTLEARLSDSKNEGQIDSIYNALVANLQEQAARRAAVDNAQAGGDKALQEALAGRRQADLAQQIATLTEARDKATANSRADTVSANEMLISLQEQIKLRALINFYGENSKQVAEARVASERRVYQAQLQGMHVSNEMRKALLAAWDVEKRMATIDLSRGIWAAVSAARALAGSLGSALSKMGQIGAETARLKIETQYEGDKTTQAAKLAEFDFLQGQGTKTGFAGAFDKVLAFGVGVAARRKAEQQAKLDAAQEAAKGGGGGGGGFADEFKDLKKSRDLAEAKRMAEEQAVAIQKMAEKKKLTADEEDRLLQMMLQHADLTDYIRQQEEKIFELKAKNGIAQLNLNQLVKDWASDNLNLAMILKDGVGSVLSDITSGFATLFTDLTSGTKSAGQAFRDFAVSVLKSLQQVIAKMLAVKAMQSLIGMMDPSGGGWLSKAFALVTGGGLMTGGMVRRKAGGGSVVGNVARDSQHHMLMPGEYVLRSSAVSAVGVDNLDRINSMGNRKAIGGMSGISKGAGQMGTTNVWVVSPDQQPVPGPNDIIAVIADDMQRGGPTKRLVKSISTGAF